MKRTVDQLIELAARQERDVRDARTRTEVALRQRNETIRELRQSGASYGDIAKALGITRAGAVGICRKLEQQERQDHRTSTAKTTG